jgi:hypothetical protein
VEAGVGVNQHGLHKGVYGICLGSGGSVSDDAVEEVEVCGGA